MTLTPSEHLELARIRFFLQAPMSFLAPLIISVLCGIVLWDYISHLLIITWVSGVYMITILRRIDWIYLGRIVRNTENLSLIRRRVYLTFITMFLSGCMWGLLGTGLNFVHEVRAESFIVLVVLGIATGASLTSAAWLPAMLILVLPMTVPLLISCLLRFDWYFLTVAAGIVLYQSLIILFVRNYGRWLDAFSKLQINNIGLVEELTAARDAATAASTAKSTFLASMSHELRTPLNFIIGFSEMIKNGISKKMDPKTIEEYASYIHEGGTHLLRIINNILDFSKIETRQVELNFAPFSLSATIRACATTVQATSVQNNISLSWNIPNEDILMEGDELRIRQVIMNLLSNGLKFTAPGGKVSLKLMRVDQNTIEISVEDTGIGMTPNEMKVALEPFGQVAAFQKEGLAGTGLGLPLSKSIVELHGGTVTLESEKGKGTTVRVRLPLRKVGPANN